MIKLLGFIRSTGRFETTWTQRETKLTGLVVEPTWAVYVNDIAQHYIGPFSRYVLTMKLSRTTLYLELTFMYPNRGYPLSTHYRTSWKHRLNMLKQGTIAQVAHMYAYLIPCEQDLEDIPHDKVPLGVLVPLKKVTEGSGQVCRT